jgi:hypothetical protein
MLDENKEIVWPDVYTSFVVAWGLLELVFPRLELLGTIVLGDVDIIVVKLASLVKTEV